MSGHACTQIGKASCPRRGRNVSMAEFRRLWADESLTLSQIGQQLGISQQAVTGRATTRGLVNTRPMGPRPSISDDTLFRDMWATGVVVADMARHFGVHQRSIRNHVTRLGLPKRGNYGWASISLADFLADRLRAQLDAAATETMAAMRLSEMVDRPRASGGVK